MNEVRMNERAAVPRLLGVSALVALIISLLLVVFVWPAVHTAPNHLPLALVAPSSAAQQLRQRLETARPGAFDLTDYGTEEQARQAIQRREVYGALLVTPTGPHILTASAASPAVAQLLTQIAGTLATPGSTAAKLVEDVVPATQDDPRQAGLGAAALPLVLSGMLSGLLLTRTFSRGRERVAGALLIAVFSGLAVAGILQGGFGTLGGSYWINGLSLSLGIGATVFLILGLEANLGAAGLGLGAAILMLLGNPFSALASAPQMYPGVWGAVGQLLPPGAIGTLLRSTAFFNGSGWEAPVLVLSVWLLVGLALVASGSARKRGDVRLDRAVSAGM
ncbi:hypothetical protein MF271_14055 [Deinococcus sp. KNUC1210]|uniref:hypothetical protein n=1 Tax=Deinococcus sp. KNUC1210 TaxID=2917691 RepID=UPI001EF06D67|nr:hypothetical protein [Deinococcus sp. KNUC1210]ULH15070.1 hypothetical protein MF271_14055 [Deinococcus sp. KNUC1210]